MPTWCRRACPCCLQRLVCRFWVAETAQPAQDEAVHGSGSSSPTDGGEATVVSEMAAAPEALCSAGQESASWLAAQQQPQPAPATVQGAAGAGSTAEQRPSSAAGSKRGKEERGRQQERQQGGGSLAAAAGGGSSRKRSTSQAAPAPSNLAAPAAGSRAQQRPAGNEAADAAAAAANKALAGARKRGSRSRSRPRSAGQGAAAEQLAPQPSPAGLQQQQQAMVEEVVAAACGSSAESMDPLLYMAAEAVGSSQVASPVAGAAAASAAAVDDSGQIVAVAHFPVGLAAMESASQSCPPQEAAELPSSGNQRPAAEGSAQAEEAVWQQCALDSCAASLPAAATPPLPDSYAAQASSSRPQSAAEGSVCSEGSAHSSLSEGSSWRVPEKPSVYGLPYNFGRNALIFHWQDPSEYACCAAAAPVVPPAARVKAAKWRADAMRQRLQSASS